MPSGREDMELCTDKVLSKGRILQELTKAVKLVSDRNANILKKGHIFLYKRMYSCHCSCNCMCFHRLQKKDDNLVTIRTTPRFLSSFPAGTYSASRSNVRNRYSSDKLYLRWHKNVKKHILYVGDWKCYNLDEFDLRCCRNIRCVSYVNY